MSGIGLGGHFELTRTRAKYWHRGRDCGCASLEAIAAQHLGDFAWTAGQGGNWLDVTGPGLGEGSTSPLFEAVSGRKSWS